MLKDQKPNPNNQVLAPTDSAGVLPVIKKPHGIKGISNDDYKISSKVDSGKQKNRR
jgi:hypothetical protein